MPKYELDGYGRESGRKRHRTYVAKDRDDLLRKAAEDGTIVESLSIKRLPDEPRRHSSRPVRHMFTKVVGVTKRNKNLTSRQKIIAKCSSGERVILDHEENNKYDRNAVRVCRGNGKQLGYLRAELAEEVVSRSAVGVRYAAFIKDVTGGSGHHPTLGVNLLVVIAEAGVSDEAAQEYVDELDFASL